MVKKTAGWFGAQVITDDVTPLWKYHDFWQPLLGKYNKWFEV